MSSSYERTCRIFFFLFFALIPPLTLSAVNVEILQQQQEGDEDQGSFEFNHFDNKAYLKQQAAEMQNGSSNSAPVIIINGSGRKQAKRVCSYGGFYSPCCYEDNEEEIYYQSGDTTIYYGNGVRPNCGDVYIIPPAHYPPFHPPSKPPRPPVRPEPYSSPGNLKTR